MKSSQPIVNRVTLFVYFLQKQSRNLKFQIFQIIRTMKVMTHLKKDLVIFKVTLVLKILKETVLIQVLLLKIVDQ